LIVEIGKVPYKRTNPVSFSFGEGARRADEVREVKIQNTTLYCSYYLNRRNEEESSVSSILEHAGMRMIDMRVPYVL
jgi:hypothetical protein